jgi:hypothetical protein
LVSRRSRTLSPLREHLTSSHWKSPSIAWLIVGDGLRRASVAPHARSSFGMRVDALEPWLGGKLGLISQKTRLAEASAMLCQREWLALFVGDGGIELLEAPLS